MELHLVHYKASYNTLTEAVKHPDGLAVFGVLFEVQETDNAAFTPMIEALNGITKAGTFLV